MPVVINEIVFKGEIGSSSTVKPEPGSSASQAPPVDLDAVVEACVEAVLRVLEQRDER